MKEAPEHSDVFDAYITKYALTKGIFKIRAVSCENNTDMIKQLDDTTWYTQFYCRSEYRLDVIAAQERAEEMRVTKLKSLDKQVKKLSAMKFDVIK